MNSFFRLKRPLTISELLKIDAGRKTRSEKIDPVLKKIHYIETDASLFQRFARFLGYKINLIGSVFDYQAVNESGSEYRVLIRTQPNFKSGEFLDNRLEVFCECSDFKFRVAFDLNKHNSLFLNKNTEKHLGVALTTKPTRVTTVPCCKHIFACIKHMERNRSTF